MQSISNSVGFPNSTVGKLRDRSYLSAGIRQWMVYLCAVQGCYKQPHEGHYYITKRCHKNLTGQSCNTTLNRRVKFNYKLKCKDHRTKP